MKKRSKARLFPLLKNFNNLLNFPSLETDFRFEGFVVLGFFVMVIYLFFETPFLILAGFIIMVLGFLPRFNLRRFLSRDIYVLGFALATLVTAFSLKKGQYPPLFINLFIVLYSLFQFGLHLKKKEPVLKKLPPPPKIVFNLIKSPYIYAGLTVAIFLSFLYLHLQYLFYIGIFFLALFIIFTIKELQNLKKEPQSKKHIQALRLQLTKTSTYETDLDRMYHLLEKRKYLKLSEIAELFSISNETAEQWGKMLEEHGLVHVHYPPIGETQIQWK